MERVCKIIDAEFVESIVTKEQQIIPAKIVMLLLDIKTETEFAADFNAYDLEKIIGFNPNSIQMVEIARNLSLKNNVEILVELEIPEKQTKNLVDKKINKPINSPNPNYKGKKYNPNYGKK